MGPRQRSVARSRADGSEVEEPWRTLREAYRDVQSRLTESLRRSGLSMSEYLALRRCEGTDATPSTIAEAVGVTGGGATDIIDRLEARRLVRRVPHPADRRARLVVVTRAGRAVCHRARSVRRSIFRRIGHSMTEEERTALLVGLRALLRSRASPTPD